MICIWLTSCCVLISLLIHYRKFNGTLRSLCYLDGVLDWVIDTFIAYFPLTLIVTLNCWILIVAEKQRKRISAETPANRNDFNQLFNALKAVKTFSIVVAVLTFCVLIPTVVGLVLDESSCGSSCRRMWYAVFHYEFYGINSIVNAYIYGMRHIKYRKAPRQIILGILRCNKLANQ
jgi:hypothetical protein